MPTRKSKQKAKNGWGTSDLRDRCWRRGFTVSGMARHINRSRKALYFAWENPDTYPLTFELLKKALAE